MEKNKDNYKHNDKEVNIEKDESDQTNSIKKQTIDENDEEILKDKDIEFEFPLNAFQLDKEIKISEYEPIKNNYPLFFQQHNTCGLSSLLMLLDPISNTKLAEFLDSIWSKVKNLILQTNFSKKEFTWSHALEYLLLKSYHENIISDYIKSRLEFEDDYFIMRVPLEVHLF